MANIIHIGGSSDDARINELSNNVEATYLKKEDASSTYLTQSDAESTYAKANTNLAFTISSNAPDNTNVFWVDTENNNLLKYYNGSEWVAISAAWG